jgi:hypothetical protein
MSRPVFENAYGSGYTTDPASWSFNGGSEDKRLMIVSSAWHETIYSITWAGESFENFGSIDSGPYGIQDLWMLRNISATGSQTLSIDQSSTKVNPVMTVVLYSGVNQANPIETGDLQHFTTSQATQYYLDHAKVRSHQIIFTSGQWGTMADITTAHCTEDGAVVTHRATGENDGPATDTRMRSYDIFLDAGADKQLYWYNSISSHAGGGTSLLINGLSTGGGATWIFSKMQDFYDELKRGLVPPDVLQKRYRELFA